MNSENIDITNDMASCNELMMLAQCWTRADWGGFGLSLNI
jgi:hypothetical protein